MDHYILRLKQAATRTDDATKAARIKKLANDLECAIVDLRLRPTTEAMIAVNALWAQGARELGETRTKGK